MRLFHRPPKPGAPTPEDRETARRRTAAENEREFAVMLREKREREETAYEAARTQAARDEIAQACARNGFWYPHESGPGGESHRSQTMRRILRVLTGREQTW